MRAFALLPVLVLAACERAPEPAPTRLPAPLHELRLAEDDPTITPVVYGHARHLDADRMGRAMTCGECHHDVVDDPTAIPRRCEACHPHEAEPHDDTKPPDI